MRFKIGDCVRTTKDMDRYGNEVFPIGTLGTITEVDNEDNNDTYLVNNTWWYSEDMLQKVENETYIYNKAYERGLEVAWELARELYCDAETCELRKAFGVDGNDFTEFGTIIKTFTPRDALEKWHRYTEQKKTRVGDVIEYGDGIIGVVTFVNGEYVCGVDSCGLLFDNLSSEDYRKTGKHIDIASIWEQIREV